MNKTILLEELKTLQLQARAIDARIDQIVELIENDDGEEKIEPTIDPNEDFGGWFEQVLAQIESDSDEIDDDWERWEEIPAPSVRVVKKPMIKPIVKAVNSPITVNFTNCFNEANRNDFAAAMLPKRVVSIPKPKESGKTAINREQKERIGFNKFVRSKMRKR